MKKLQLIIAALLIFSTNTIFAQPYFNKKHRELIKAKKIVYIKEKLQLTDSEEKLFIPVYNEFDEKREELFVKKRKIFRKYRKNYLNLSDEETSKMSDSFVEVDYQIALLQKEYHEKFKKVLQAQKILILYKSEHDFKKYLIRRMGKKHGKFRDK